MITQGTKAEPMWEEAPLLSPEQVQTLDPNRIPKHIAFIPDGNRRWAKKHLALPEKGHRAGAETLMNTIKAGSQLGVEVMTFYIFSTENWLRPKREIEAQMWLLEKSLIEQKQRMVENGVRFSTIGETSKFPSRIIELLEEVKEATKQGDKITLVFALNYGGRDDIRRAVQKIITDYDNKKFKKEEITEELISQYLDTANWADPDLLIRTSGESRISNFLLWQISYAEIYLPKVYWPEFSPEHFVEAISEYQKRERRLGGS
ncbi:MAG: polyprenyl diphosphate synthase [Waddliaceae bacterium]